MSGKPTDCNADLCIYHDYKLCCVKNVLVSSILGLKN